MQQEQWHYNDDRKGRRLGPVDREEVIRLIAADRIERATLVWNPTMPEWAKASTTDLGSLFGDSPPPLPASEIGRWAIYALAFIPLVGLLVQALTSVGLRDRLELSPRDMFDHWGWIGARQ